MDTAGLVEPMGAVQVTDGMEIVPPSEIGICVKTIKALDLETSTHPCATYAAATASKSTVHVGLVFSSARVIVPELTPGVPALVYVSAPPEYTALREVADDPVAVSVPVTKAVGLSNVVLADASGAATATATTGAAQAAVLRTPRRVTPAVAGDSDMMHSFRVRRSGGRPMADSVLPLPNQAE